MFEFCSDFSVTTSKELIEKHGLHHLVSLKSRPSDHSLLKVVIQVTETIACNDNRSDPLSSVTSTPNDITYNVRNIPNDFMKSNETCNEIIELIQQQELCNENQINVDTLYDKLVTCIFNEMERQLPKYTGVKSRKKYKIKKPYWNDELKGLWSDMCNKEKIFLKFRGPHHVRKLLRQRFLDASSNFNKRLRRAERNYNKQLQNEIESVCTDNPRQFWEYVKKLGPKTSKKIIEEVYDDNGEVKRDLESVLQKWKIDFENLYKTDSTTFDNDFYTEIKALLRNSENNMIDPLYVSNGFLNRNISLDEVSTVIDRLKNNKAPGIDKIPNEVLRNDSVKQCLLTFFQFYFDTGLLPQCWGQAVIKPIPKSRSNDPRIPLNYRGINLLSCIYKTYSTVINRRLLAYLENNKLLCDEQNGFRANRSCLEHIYTLYTIIKNRKNESKDTYVAFIDFTKCFDLIDRDMLYFKLVENGIDGKMYFTLKKMYSNTMSCININGNLTDWFYTTNGCRQGDVTSPTAFSILINDLLKEIKATQIGIKINDLILNILAYADDIVLLAESPEQLQSLINIMNKWCNKYRLIVNPGKSKVVHFRNPPKQQCDFNFQLGNDGPKLEIVENYKYLGTFFDEYLTFTKATEVLNAAANRALGGMINKFRSMRDMGYKTYSKLYESMVCPVMDYGSAIWGMKNYDKLEQVHHRAIRFFTGVHRLCPIPGYVGDMGWIDNVSRWKIERIRLWNRLIDTENERLVKKIFAWDCEVFNRTNKSNFVSYVKQICSELNFNDCFTNQQKLDLSALRIRLTESMGEKWRDRALSKDKLIVYNQIKTSFGVDNFLLLNIDRYERSLLSQLRYGILPLRVETGRFVGESHNDRTCTLCKSNNVENETHFLFYCDLYKIQRQELYTKARELYNDWDTMTDYTKLINLFDTMTRKFAKYVKSIFLIRRNTIYR